MLQPVGRTKRSAWLLLLAAAVVAAAGSLLLLQKRGAGPSGHYDFSVDPDAYPGTKPSEVVHLKDGESFSLSAVKVQETIAGAKVKQLAYNGSVPGPFFWIPQGAHITVSFANQTGIATTIHSHGVRQDNAQDGVPDVTQPAIAPGASYVYHFRFPDPGVYWYHPHFRDDFEQELGLFGVYMVEPTEKDYWGPANREVPLVLSDILIKDGVVPEYHADYINFAFMGRYGNIPLVNGKTHAVIDVKKGEVLRLYLVDSASARPFRIQTPGVQMKLVGTDGGRYEREQWVDAVVVSPSERQIVECYFPKEGEYKLIHHAVDPLVGARTYELVTFRVGSEEESQSYAKEFATLRENKATIDETEALATRFRDTPPDKTIRFLVSVSKQAAKGLEEPGSAPSGAPKPGAAFPGLLTILAKTGAKVEWEDHMYNQNKASTSREVHWQIVDLDTGKVLGQKMEKGMGDMGGNIDWTFKQGSFAKIRIINDIHSLHPMQHPFHIHGQRFLVLNTNGEDNPNKAWKDTVLVGAGDTMDILVEMSNPGTWMAHCHILEHLHSGMMFSFAVTP
ncbi:multicopper oxidase family protein [Methylacidimicrobium sp. B4]|uniref:multicopper oxidase family protein n=1 Tax=Methylacidimicrobium sp. B4 TaxID=2796139 RepID=UPI001A8F6FE2|nr:multicopper oxidase family protein [Methylacidimicrobium sp. B4]QSR85388.1 multicopper oxidase family protein [Methylacidimicrobium sp. B4]